jgi:putative transposase
MPRPIFPGKSYLVSRRCTQRQFLLKPSPIVNLIVLFCMAYAALKTGILIHAYCVMSNHWHVVVTDPQGRLPEFVEWVHKYVAKCLNLLWGRCENVWSSEKPSYVELIDPIDILDKILYVLLNPVASHLVARSRQWPGLISSPQDYLRLARKVERPGIFFRSRGSIPESVNLQMTVPPSFQNIAVKDFVRLVSELLKKQENNQLRKLSQTKTRVAGRERVLAQSHLATPESSAPHNTLNPRVAGRNKWKRLESVRRIKSFIRAYREAREKKISGDHEALFPAGTYWLKRFGGVSCHSEPSWAP